MGQKEENEDLISRYWKITGTNDIMWRGKSIDTVVKKPH